MLATDLRTGEQKDTKTFIIVVDEFTKKIVMKFTFDSGLREWRDPTVKVACVDSDVLINCF